VTIGGKMIRGEKLNRITEGTLGLKKKRKKGGGSTAA